MWLNTPLVDAFGHCPGLSIPSPQPCVIRPEATISPLRNSPLTRTQRQCWRKAEFPWENPWSFKKYRISNFRGCPQLWHDGLIFIVFPYITTNVYGFGGCYQWHHHKSSLSRFWWGHSMHLSQVKAMYFTRETLHLSTSTWLGKGKSYLLRKILHRWILHCKVSREKYAKIISHHTMWLIIPLFVGYWYPMMDHNNHQ